MEQDELSHDRGQVKSTEQPEVKQVAPRPLPLMNLRQKLKTEAKYLKITQAKSNM